MAYRRLVDQITLEAPSTHLFLQSILPTKNIELRNNDDIKKINLGIENIARDFQVVYINIFDLLLDKNNELSAEFSIDGLHLNGKGYRIWADRISPHLLSE